MLLYFKLPRTDNNHFLWYTERKTLESLIYYLPGFMFSVLIVNMNIKSFATMRNNRSMQGLVWTWYLYIWVPPKFQKTMSSFLFPASRSRNARTYSHGTTHSTTWRTKIQTISRCTAEMTGTPWVTGGLEKPAVGHWGHGSMLRGHTRPPRTNAACWTMWRSRTGIWRCSRSFEVISEDIVKVGCLLTWHSPQGTVLRSIKNGS